MLTAPLSKHPVQCEWFMTAFINIAICPEKHKLIKEEQRKLFCARLRCLFRLILMLRQHKKWEGWLNFKTSLFRTGSLLLTTFSMCPLASVKEQVVCLLMWGKIRQKETKGISRPALFSSFESDPGSFLCSYNLFQQILYGHKDHAWVLTITQKNKIYSLSGF